jgi:hypothetical protein
MSVNRPVIDDKTEACESCGRQTPHTVRIEIRTESKQQQNAAYSREPYRVAACDRCGTESALRMNNA